MTEVSNTQTRVYSNDGQLYAGMTQKEVYEDEKLLRLFTFADKNNDRVLDEKEIIRYNSPIYVENFETKVGRFIGHLGVKIYATF